MSRKRNPTMRRAGPLGPAGHHSVYVVYLRDPKGDGKAGYYVGMTGLTPEARFENHKRGVRAAGEGGYALLRLEPPQAGLKVETQDRAPATPRGCWYRAHSFCS